MKHLITILLAIFMLTPTAARGDDAPNRITEVRVHSTVRLKITETDITLGDLAKLDGPQAAQLQALVITIVDPIQTGQWSTLQLATVREQLKAAPGINFGAIMMHGSDIQITRVADRSKPQPHTQTVDEQPAPTSNTLLREYIERWVYARLKVTPQETRITFNERDHSLLSTPTAGRVVEIRELGRSDLMSLGIVVYEHERIVLERTIRFEALIERPVLVTTTQIKRDTPITSDTTRLETRWLPTTEPIADPANSIGQVTVSTIDPGSVLISSMIEAPILVDRGQIVSARSLAGSVSVSIKARARQSGRLGEIIELESRDRTQKFNARVAGPGRVVIMHDATDSQPSASSAMYGSP